MLPVVSSSRRRSTVPDDDTEPGVPYVFPRSRPYNAPQGALIPTYDGSNYMVHTSVLDFAQLVPEGEWHGWRYWMVMTPFPNANDDVENPSIVVSANGFTWQEPDGITNPIYPEPAHAPATQNFFNSDPDIEYDVENDRLVLIYREKKASVPVTLYTSSPDGITWPDRSEIGTWGLASAAGYYHVSPAICRRGPNDWWGLSVNGTTRALQSGHSTAPNTGWTPINLGQADFGEGYTTPWHGDMVSDGELFYILMMVHGQSGVQPNSIFAGTWDGVAPAITWNLNPVLQPQAGGWEATLYRPSLTMHENGTHMRVWYDSAGRVGYTHIPLTEWPTL